MVATSQVFLIARCLAWTIDGPAYRMYPLMGLFYLIPVSVKILSKSSALTRVMNAFALDSIVACRAYAASTSTIASYSACPTVK